MTTKPIQAKGHRMSSLPIVQYCSAAGALANKHGAGRAAAMSTWLHAHAAGEEEEAAALFARLSPEEQEKVRTWKIPEPVDLGGGIVLRWEEAIREVEVCLLEDGSGFAEVDHCGLGTPLPEELHGMIMSIGHVDGAWLEEVDGNKIVYVADIKKSDFTTDDGHESLQLLAYGHALAAAWDADAYCTGIWNCTDGNWDWGPLRDVHDMSETVVWGRIQAAAMNTDGSYATGSHCRGCWSRLRCQEHLLPVSDPAAALAPFAEPSERITRENACEILLMVQAAEEVVKSAKETMVAWAERNGPIPDGNGKIWRKVTTDKPLEKFDHAKLRKDHPELAKQYVQVKTGIRSMGFRWCKEGK